jgi:S-adenosylmethionine:tRNA ribosyltransferase-isomerase
LLISEFDYALPEELIAQQPTENRDDSRMMVLNRATQAVEHRCFRDLPCILTAGDLLVVNESRVLPVRLLTHRRDTRGRVVVLLVEKIDACQWKALLQPSRRLKTGCRLEVPGEAGYLEVIEKGSYGLCRLRAEFRENLEAICDRHGLVPLPPYIKRIRGPSNVQDRQRYQTIYAQTAGSIAAPTAGLHFTKHVFQNLEKAGIQICALTLHVGLATFQPVRVSRVEEHHLESERCYISETTAAQINQAKQPGRRVLAVGTTTTRTLESNARHHQGHIVPGWGLADIFIHPPYSFQIVDGLLTNFHLPQSSLLILVSAFAGREWILDCYRQAVENKYRFYSYGDCMLIV